MHCRNLSKTLNSVDGPFKGGIFRFKLELEKYPKEPPVLRLTTPLFHPWVDPLTGELELSDSCKTITLALERLKMALMMETLTSATRIRNTEAYDCWTTDVNHALKRAHICALKSIENLYDEPDSEIVFKPILANSLEQLLKST